MTTKSHCIKHKDDGEGRGDAFHELQCMQLGSAIFCGSSTFTRINTRHSDGKKVLVETQTNSADAKRLIKTCLSAHRSLLIIFSSC